MGYFNVPFLYRICNNFYPEAVAGWGAAGIAEGACIDMVGCGMGETSECISTNIAAGMDGGQADECAAGCIDGVDGDLGGVAGIGYEIGARMKDDADGGGCGRTGFAETGDESTNEAVVGGGDIV